MSEPTGFELDVESFDIYMEALQLKMKEEGADPSNPAEVFETMRRWWYIMQDTTAVRAYIASQHHDELIAEEADLQATLAVVQTQLENE